MQHNAASWIFPKIPRRVFLLPGYGFGFFSEQTRQSFSLADLHAPCRAPHRPVLGAAHCLIGPDPDIVSLAFGQACNHSGNGGCALRRRVHHRPRPQAFRRHARRAEDGAPEHLARADIPGDDGE